MLQHVTSQNEFRYTSCCDGLYTPKDNIFKLNIMFSDEAPFIGRAY
jgi:hypothetical protein